MTKRTSANEYISDMQSVLDYPEGYVTFIRENLGLSEFDEDRFTALVNPDEPDDDDVDPLPEVEVTEEQRTETKYFVESLIAVLIYEDLMDGQDADLAEKISQFNGLIEEYGPEEGLLDPSQFADYDELWDYWRENAGWADDLATRIVEAELDGSFSDEIVRKVTAIMQASESADD